MTKTIPEIDDETITRSIDAYNEAFKTKGNWEREAMAAAIRAALTEPEIEATSVMLNEGRVAMNAWWDVEDDDQEGVPVAGVYRAMVKAAHSGAKSAQQWVAGDAPEQVIGDAVGHWGCRIKTGAPQGVNAGAPEKAPGGGVGGAWRNRRANPGRRSTDPKPQQFYGMTRD
jgi:hypothetical protein